MADNAVEKREESPDRQHQEKRESSPGDSFTSPIPPTKPSEPSGIWKYFAKLGNLPEWEFGKKKLAGKALNYSIGICASCGFLMFGYDQGVMSALLTLDDLLVLQHDRGSYSCTANLLKSAQPPTDDTVRYLERRLLLRRGKNPTQS
jgi:hypothetical protein